MESNPKSFGETIRALAHDHQGYRCGPIEVTQSQFDELIAAIGRDKAARAAKMPDEAAALAQLTEAYRRLEELGWRDAIYCPKDGSIFDALEAGSTGIFECTYSGEWPTGSWWISDGGDLWPARPILYRAGLSAPSEPMERG